MFRSKLLTSLFCLITSTGFAGIINSVEVRAAAFFPTSERYKESLGPAAFNYQIEFGKRFGLCCQEEIWLNIDWTPQSDRLDSCGKSEIDTLNGSFGYKHFWCTCPCINVYAGIGPVFGYSWIKNRRDCCPGCTSWTEKEGAFAVGGIARLGLVYDLTRCLFLDVFIDYLAEVAFFHRTAYIGGLRTGLGLGVKF